MLPEEVPHAPATMAAPPTALGPPGLPGSAGFEERTGLHAGRTDRDSASRNHATQAFTDHRNAAGTGRSYAGNVTRATARSDHTSPGK